LFARRPRTGAAEFANSSGMFAASIGGESKWQRTASGNARFDISYPDAERSMRVASTMSGNPSFAMHLSGPAGQPEQPEAMVYESLLPLAHARVLELGCGRAEATRAIAQRHPDAHITAMEVDTMQHEINIAQRDLPNVDYVEGAAQAIPAPDASFDIVMMLKSLHHVPGDLLDAALAEIHRVLVPGGLVYVSEPVFAGAYNDIVKIFHDEGRVRIAAF